MLSICISCRRKAAEWGLRVGAWVDAGSETIFLFFLYTYICNIKVGGAAYEGIKVCTFITCVCVHASLHTL